MSSFDHTSLVQSLNQGMSRLRQSQPEAMQGFGQLAKAAMAAGAIDEKHKEMIALAIGITQHCSGCIGFHVKAALDQGASQDEVIETLGMAIYMGAGPSVMYASHALEAFMQFKNQDGKPSVTAA